MTHARARSMVLTPAFSPMPAWMAPDFGVAAMTPAPVAAGTCWLMSTPINLYALAYQAAQMNVRADRQAWYRRFAASAN